MKVYIAGPLSSDDPAIKLHNVERGMTAALQVMELGHTPFLPHLFYYLEQHAILIGVRISYERWMEQDMKWLRRCAALIYLGSSPGADRELAEAKRLDLQVFDSVESFARWIKSDYAFKPGVSRETHDGDV